MRDTAERYRERGVGNSMHRQLTRTRIDAVSFRKDGLTEYLPSASSNSLRSMEKPMLACEKGSEPFFGYTSVQRQQ